MENTGSILQRKAHQAHQVVDEVAQRASARAGPAIDRAAQTAHQTVDKVAGAAVPAAQWVAQSADQLRRQQEEFATACRGYVRERPLVAIATALTAGFLIGRLGR
jgi:ElaB/YqjD/DUF883 family membrane-anchored ribosome-binding protein